MRKWIRGRRRAWLVVPVVLLVAAGCTGAWLLTRDSSAAAQSTTATVSRETVKQTVSADGTLAAAKTRDQSFEVSGTVTRVDVDEGDRVTKGQVLATVGRAQLLAARTAAASSLDAAVEQLDTDEDDDASDVQLAADQAAIVSARATLTDARADVENATLRAGISGIVTDVGISKGDSVGPSSLDGSAGSGGSISLVSRGSYVVDATVAAEDAGQLTKGMQADITLTGATDTVYGTVSDVGLVAQTNDSGAAVFPVTVAVTGKQEDLYAGVSATVSIVVKQVPDVLTVVSRALSTENGRTYVTKLVDGKEVKTVVETGQTYGMTTEITKGLEEGDEVVVPGFTMPTGGSDGGGGEGPQNLILPGGGGQLPQFNSNGGPGQ